MSKSNYFKYKKLRKEFEKFMQDGNIEKAKQIHEELLKLENN